jgi:hypothetical protein
MTRITKVIFVSPLSLSFCRLAIDRWLSSEQCVAVGRLVAGMQRAASLGVVQNDVERV